MTKKPGQERMELALVASEIIRGVNKHLYKSFNDKKTCLDTVKGLEEKIFTAKFGRASFPIQPASDEKWLINFDL